MGPIADAEGWIAPGEAHLFFPHRRGSLLRDSGRFSMRASVRATRTEQSPD